MSTATATKKKVATTPNGKPAARKTASRSKKAPATTIVNFVLDESGSMMQVRDATISGFNEYVDTLRRDKTGDYFLTLTKFNSSRVQTMYQTTPLKLVKRLTERNYTPNYGTPLYDAIAKTIHETEHSLLELDLPANTRVLVVIQTDGFENDSRTESRQSIYKLIESKQGQGWLFTFLGADQNAWVAGTQLGIHRHNTVSYNHNDQGTRMAFQTVARATVSYAAGAVLGNSLYASEDAVDLRNGDLSTIGRELNGSSISTGGNGSSKKVRKTTK